MYIKNKPHLQKSKHNERSLPDWQLQLIINYSYEISLVLKKALK